MKSVRIRSYSGPLFFRIRTEYGEVRSVSPYSVGMRGNADQNNSEYGHFSRSVVVLICIRLYIIIVVTYCYLKKENYKDLEFLENDSLTFQ